MHQLRLAPPRLAGGEFEVKAVFPYAGAARTWVCWSRRASVPLNKCFSLGSRFAMLLVWERCDLN